MAPFLQVLEDQIVVLGVHLDVVLALVELLGLANRSKLAVVGTHGLDLLQLVVSQAETSEKHRNTQAKTDNTQESLDVGVSENNGFSGGRAPGVDLDEIVWLLVGLSSQGRVNTHFDHLVVDGVVHSLGPHDTGDTVTESRTELVSGHVDTGNGSHVLVVSTRLDGDIDGTSKQTRTETEHNHGAHDTVNESLVVDTVVRTTEVVKHTGTDEPERDTSENETLGSSDTSNHQTKKRTDNGNHKGVQRTDSGGSGLGGVHSDKQNRVHVVVRHQVDELVEQTDTHGGNDTTVLQEREGENRVGGASELPVDENRNQAETNNQWSDNVGMSPLGGSTTGKGQWDQKETNTDGEKEDTHDVGQPEELLEVVVGSDEEGLDVAGVLVVAVTSGLGNSVVHVNVGILFLLAKINEGLLLAHLESGPDQAAHDGDVGKREDESPHTDGVLPGVVVGQVGDDVTGNPGVDDVRTGDDGNGEKSPVHLGVVGHDQTQHDLDTSLTKSVNNGTGSELGKVTGLRLNQRTHGFENHSNQKQLHTSVHIRHSGEKWQGSSSHHGSDNSDSGQKRVVSETVGGVRSKHFSDTSVQGKNIGRTEQANVKKDTVTLVLVVLGQKLVLSHTKRLGRTIDDFLGGGVVREGLFLSRAIVAQLLIGRDRVGLCGVLGGVPVLLNGRVGLLRSGHGR